MAIGLVAGMGDGALAQVDRSKAPLPGPAHEIKIGEYQSFTLENGLQVFVVENHKLPRVQFSIQLKHDPVFEGEKAGYVSIAGALMGTGTAHRTKAQLDEEIDFIGASLNTSAYGLYASSLKKHTEKLLELITDVLYNPSFEQSELDKLKTQTISGIAAGKDDPGTIASNVRGFLLYGKNHPYGEVATEKTVASISIEDCRGYYNTYFKPNNAYLVMVGDITMKAAKKAAKENFSQWKKGEVKNETFPFPPAPQKTFVALVDRPASVQSIINIAYPVDLKVGSEDALKAKVMNQVLGGSFSARLNQNLREEHAYTYGASSQLTSDDLVGRFSASASVRNEVTDSAIYQVLFELNRIVNGAVGPGELKAAKASIAGAFGRSLERPQTIAGFAVNTAKYNLPKDYYSSYLKRLDAVSVADVQEAAQKYIRPGHAYIEVVGKGAEVEKGLGQFGEVKYYDINGNEYVPKAARPLPAGLTAEKVIENYLVALGGRQGLGKIKSVKLVYKANAMGQDLYMKIYKSPGKSLMEISNGSDFTFQKTLCNEGTVSMMVMGNKQSLSDGEEERIKFESAVFPDLHLEAAKISLVALGQLDGKDVYVVEATFPKGAKKVDYFDVETGLKVKVENEVSTPEGPKRFPLVIEGYKEVQGIRFPSKLVQQQGPVQLTFELQEIEINPTLESSIFE